MKDILLYVTVSDLIHNNMHIYDMYRQLDTPLNAPQRILWVNQYFRSFGGMKLLSKGSKSACLGIEIAFDPPAMHFTVPSLRFEAVRNEWCRRYKILKRAFTNSLICFIVKIC